MFPVLENIDKTKPKTGNHYRIFNMNIRDRRFEALDSWRTLKNKALDVCARKMVASFRDLWEEHYATLTSRWMTLGLPTFTSQNKKTE